jgi:hypothetical protein
MYVSRWVGVDGIICTGIEFVLVFVFVVYTYTQIMSSERVIRHRPRIRHSEVVRGLLRSSCSGKARQESGIGRASAAWPSSSLRTTPHRVASNDGRVHAGRWVGRWATMGIK